MELFLATKTGTPIIGQIASVMGWIMDGIYKMLDGLFGIQNIGLCIIIFSILIFAFMTPLQIKQQKFSKLSAIMQPEIQKIQKKYQGKKDQASMMKMNEETQAVYQKYGVSPTGSCVQLAIQMPILFALYQVIYRIPAYVGSVKNIFTGVVDNLLAVNRIHRYPAAVYHRPFHDTSASRYGQCRKMLQVTRLLIFCMHFLFPVKELAQDESVFQDFS